MDLGTKGWGFHTTFLAKNEVKPFVVPKSSKPKKHSFLAPTIPHKNRNEGFPQLGSLKNSEGNTTLTGNSIGMGVTLNEG
jgi:hypothetical protein